MGCPGGCGQSVVAPTTGMRGPTQTLNHTDCEGVGLDLLEMFKRMILCIQNFNLYTQASVTTEEIANSITLLNTWIEIKRVNPGACDHQEKLPIIQAIIVRILPFAKC